MTINHPTVFIRKSCYDRFGMFDLSYRVAMDYDLLLRMKVNHCRFAYIPAVLAHMRWDGLSDRHWKKDVRETLAVKNKYLPHKKWGNQLYYYKHVLAIGTNKLLLKLHLHKLTRLYRQWLAPVKKTYH
jgi:hypothetical protein